ncbi:hypothetical protein HQ544_00910 [Candidatus Falkowbacteria bacterium]|nr:hypothetical protein [Candidatus Falkowbacteria bacterium]
MSKTATTVAEEFTVPALFQSVSGDQRFSINERVYRKLERPVGIFTAEIEGELKAGETKLRFFEGRHAVKVRKE